jgi:hypothetical protein
MGCARSAAPLRMAAQSVSAAPKLTKRKLKAIIEALTARTAGEIDIADEQGSPARDDYEHALDWADYQLDKRNGR